jgi:hypothetical protein
MLRLTSKRVYKKVPGHRRIYKSPQDLLVPGDSGNLVFVPRGRKLEVSVLKAAPDTGRPEVALLYHGHIIRLIPGTADPRAALEDIRPL